MTMKFGNQEVTFKNYEAAQKHYAELVKDKTANDTDKTEAFSDMMNSLGADSAAYIQEQINAKTEAFLDMKRQDPTLTAEEIKFVNEVKTDSSLDKPSTTEIAVPQTVVDRIFEDLKTDHPLLSIIGLKNQGIRTKIYTSDAEGVAVWDDFMGDIKGQLTAKFGKSESIQNKITAYMTLPKDLKEFGASWIMNYIVTEMREAIYNAAESTFLSGDGVKKPIGLDRDLSKGSAATDGSGVVTYPQKASAGTLTFENTKAASKQVAEVLIKLSKKENGKPVQTSGKVVFIMSPAQHLRLQAQFMVQNVNGQFVTAYPFGMRIVESVFQADDKAVVFVQGRYDAYEAGAMTIASSADILFFEDEMAYAIKHFFYGKARDNNAALVYDLDFAAPGSDTAQTTTGGETGEEDPKA